MTIGSPQAQACSSRLATDGPLREPTAHGLVDSATEVLGAQHVELRDVHAGANGMSIVIAFERNRMPTSVSVSVGTRVP